MTLYALWLSLCGMSQREAAEFHQVRLDTVKSWSTGRNPAKPKVIDELRSLRARIVEAAEHGFSAWNEAGRIPLIDLGVASDDHEAQSLGWPCIGAQQASLAVMVAMLPPDIEVRIVPRGSTSATAAAADAHGR